MPQQTRYANIKRKESIPPEDRTEGKDQAAEIIDELRESGEWPVPLTQLNDETEWSRSHYKNTLSDYYEIVDEDNRDATHAHENGRFVIEVPEDVDRMSYLRGWIDRETELRD